MRATPRRSTSRARGWAQTAVPSTGFGSANAKVNSTGGTRANKAPHLHCDSPRTLRPVERAMVAHERIPRMAHMPLRDAAAWDLYARAADGGWRLSETAGQVNKTATNPRLNSSMAQKPQTRMPAVPARVQRTKSLDIGVPAGSQVEKASSASRRFTQAGQVYGTSIIKADVHRGRGDLDIDFSAACSIDP